MEASKIYGVYKCGTFPTDHPGHSLLYRMALEERLRLFTSLSDWIVICRQEGHQAVMLVGDDPGSTPSFIRRNHPAIWICNEADARTFLKTGAATGQLSNHVQTGPAEKPKEINPGYGSF